MLLLHEVVVLEEGFSESADNSFVSAHYSNSFWN